MFRIKKVDDFICIAFLGCCEDNHFIELRAALQELFTEGAHTDRNLMCDTVCVKQREAQRSSSIRIVPTAVNQGLILQTQNIIDRYIECILKAQVPGGGENREVDGENERKSNWVICWLPYHLIKNDC